MAAMEVIDPLVIAELRTLNANVVLLINRIRRLDDNMEFLQSNLIPAGQRPAPMPGAAQLPQIPQALVKLDDLLQERANGPAAPRVY